MAVGVAFFLSGAAALVYQVAWQRILALHSGAGIYSVAMIVAAFMAGLGLGSHLGGRLSARLSGPLAALRLFAGLELGVGLFGASSGWLFYDVLYPLAPALHGAPWRTGLAHFLALVLPTGLMGMSLPILARGVVRDGPTAGAILGRLYGLNVLGAAVGALLAPWFLLRLYGVRGAVLAAALGNLVAGLVVLAMLRSAPAAPEPAPPTPPGRPVSAPGETASFRVWLALYALSGFCALSLEIVWFRVVDVAVKSTAFTFGTVLFVYLLGSAAGSFIGSRLAEGLVQPLRAFLLCQCVLLAYAGAAFLGLTLASPDLPVYQSLVSYWGDGNPFVPGRTVGIAPLVGLYLGLPLYLYGIPTALMGLSFPILQRAVQDEAATSGLKVGLLQASNIAGCVAGSLLVGLVALSQLGTMGSVRGLLVCGLVFAAIGVRRSPLLFGSLAAILGTLVVVLPGNEALWRRLHGGPGSMRALIDEDPTAVVALTSRREGHWRVWTNGHSHSQLPYGGVHTLLGALPVLVHPQPDHVAIIGLGSGDTAWASACRSATSRVTVFEIAAPQARLLQRLRETETGLPDLVRFLDDRRVEIRAADGRNALLREETRYDVIEMDALWAFYAGSGNLYSEEFLRLAAGRLKPRGLMCIWAPTERVLSTFTRVFPHVFSARQVLVGSRERLHGRDLASWLARLDESAAYLGAERRSEIEGALRMLTRAAASDELAVNTDLFPRDEFDLGGRGALGLLARAPAGPR